MQYRPPTNPKLREFTFHYKDGHTSVVESEGWPWVYGAWLCIAPADEPESIQSRANDEVDHYTWRDIQEY